MDELKPFATPEDMESRSLGQITAATHPFLANELAAATRLIRDACGWHVAEAVSVRYRRTWGHAEAVWLPAMEVASVDAVTVDGVAFDVARVAAVEFDRDTGWTNLCGRSVDVTFTAGFETVPETIVSLTLQAAARALGSPLGLVREQAGTVSVTHSQSGFNIAGGMLLLEPEVATLTPYRLGRLP